MWKHLEKTLGSVLTIFLMAKTIQTVEMDGIQTKRPKIDLKKPLNVDYILNYLTTNVPYVWPYDEHGFGRSKRDVTRDLPVSSEPPTLGELGERPTAVGGGPGWVEIQVPWPPLDEPLEYVLSYKPRGARKYFQAAPVRFTRAWTHAAAVAEAGPLAEEPLHTPLTPCPAWVRSGLFCLVVTDHVTTYHRFKDFEAKLTIRGMNYVNKEEKKQSCKTELSASGIKETCEIKQKNDPDKSTRKMIEKNITYKFSFRAWNCDPTLTSFDCSDIGKEMDLSLFVPEVVASVPVPLVGLQVPVRWLRTVRHMWPLMLLLLLLVACVGLPVVFLRAKRAGQRAALQEIFLREQVLLSRLGLSPEGERGRKGAALAPALVVAALPRARASPEPPAKKSREW